MREPLLEFICCPQCQSNLAVQPLSKQDDQITSGTLECSNGHSYPIRDSLPVFAEEFDYMKAFSGLRAERAGDLQPTVDLDVVKITLDEFVRQTGIQPEDLSGKSVLDAGCGGGRFTELLAKHGARIVAVDIDSTGLRYISDRLKDYSNAHFLQADLFKLPLKPNSFDFIFSLGVLHHTPDPKGAFIKLTKLLKPNGEIAVWVYPKSEPTPLSDLLRPVTTRMPFRVLYMFGWAVTKTYGPLLKIRGVDWRLRSLLYRARLPWHSEHNWRLHSFIDWYGPKYQFKYHPEEIESWFTEAGLVDLVRCPYKTSARGRAVAILPAER